jgi:glutamate formiminotransferase
MKKTGSGSDALLECVPNFSEGQRVEVVQAIVAQMKTVDGVVVLDVEMDASHNRAVVTLAGPPESVVEAAFRAVGQAARLIDMDAHRGQHPRIGATDVVPLVPLRGLSMDECVVLARALGRRIGDELDIPVYIYGEAALLPERRDLPGLRRGEYEGLREEIRWNADRRPDFGPARLGKAGATVVGARWPLIAFNVNLASRDLRAARAVARAVRESSGGLPAVRAMGVDLPALAAVQVSMNLTDYGRTSMLDAFRAVETAAAARGIAVLNSEVVGLAPEQALPPDAEHALKLAGFSQEQILERRLGMA